MQSAYWLYGAVNALEKQACAADSAGAAIIIEDIKCTRRNEKESMITDGSNFLWNHRRRSHFIAFEVISGLMPLFEMNREADDEIAQSAIKIGHDSSAIHGTAIT